MNASEAQQARLALELRPEDLAADLNTTPDAVAAWESGRIRVPKHVEGNLRWRVAVLERSRALEASGLPECTWIEAFEQRPLPDRLDAQAKQLEELTEHAQSCEVCKAREAFIAERFPPMPRPPVQGWSAVAVPVFERIGRLPAWAQPAATGAIAFATYSLFRLLFLIPTLIHDPMRGSLTALGGISASASIGAVLGLIYGQYRRIRDARAAHRSGAPS